LTNCQSQRLADWRISIPYNSEDRREPSHGYDCVENFCDGIIPRISLRGRLWPTRDRGGFGRRRDRGALLEVKMKLKHHIEVQTIIKGRGDQLGLKSRVDCQVPLDHAWLGSINTL
jgi:hypothetical protein